MSLSYKLLRIPRTREEILERARKTDKKIDLSVGEEIHKYAPGISTNYECFPVLRRPRSYVALQDLGEKRLIMFGTRQGELLRLDVQESMFERLIGMASELEQEGLQVTLKGLSVEEAKERAGKYYASERKRM